MTEKEMKRTKELEAFLNYKLDVARAAAEIPMDKILGVSTVYMCTNSEKAQKWREDNERRYSAAD